MEMSDEKQKIMRKLKKAIPDMDDAEKTVLTATINALSASAEYRKKKHTHETCTKIRTSAVT